ncbi:hypothetical protein [Acidaminococcus fermentans]|uniref:hypothetical protein n=1 Tax=Acidaminococcus fermentans TaxID=905 RepID=UPI003F8AFD93
MRTKRASVCTFILIVFFIFTIIVPVYANDIDNSNYIQNASIGNITFDDDFDLDTISEVLGPFDSVEKTITDIGFIEKTYYFERGTVDVLFDKVVGATVIFPTSPTGETLSTPRGVTVGEYKTQILKAYGRPAYVQSDIYFYGEGPYNLCFHLNKSGYVKAISYFVDGL